jgi:VWFA-related protein
MISALLLSVAASAQQPPSVTIRAETRIVVVDAVVTDERGNHVPGLTASDFTILENGVPQRIAAFSFEDSSAVSAATSSSALADGWKTNRPQEGAGPAVVFLFDCLNTPVADQAYMRQQVADYFRRGALPRGQYAIYVLKKNLDVAQDFTSDPKLLLQGAEHFKPVPPFPSAMANARSVLQQQVAALVAQDMAQDALAALRLIARNVQRFHGRKTIVWLSSGLPAALMDPLMTGPIDYATQVRQTANLLTEAEVSVYPVDVRGLATVQAFDASHSGTGGDAQPVLAPSADRPPIIDLDRRGRGPIGGPTSVGTELGTVADEQNTMELVAIETGGRVAKNRNDLDTAVGETVSDTTTYYSLAYYPANKKWDQKFRRIEVKAARPGLRVLARRGYYALDPEKRDDKQQEKEFIALLLAGGPEASMVDFDAQVAPSSTAGTPHLAIDIRVDPFALQGEDTAEHTTYSLEWHAVVIANDKRRTIAAHTDQQVTTSVAETAIGGLRDRGVPLHANLQVLPGDYVVHLGVRDLRSGKYGTLEVPLTVKQPGKQ